MKRKVALVVVVLIGVSTILVSIAHFALRGPEVPVLRLSREPFLLKVRADGILKAIDSTPISTPVSAGTGMTIAWIVEDGTYVKKGDVVVRFDPSEFEKGLRDGEADETIAKEKIAKAKAQSQSVDVGLELDASMAKKDMANAKAFQTKDEHIFSRFEIASSLMDTELAQSRADYAQEMKKAKGTLARTEVDLHSIEAQKGDRDVKRAQASYDAREVRAPHDGVVILQRNGRGELPRPGNVMWPGQKLAEIPKPGGLQAEVYILEADAGGLAVGQRVEAEPFGYYGAPIAAVVSRVDTLAQPRFPDVPVQYFGATLKFVGKVPDSLVPGQRIEAEIIMADVPDALVVPRQAIFQRDGHGVVYKKGIMGSFKAVPVTLGQGAPGRVVVTRGIEAGDVVALVDPTMAKPAEAEASNTAGPSAGGAP